MIDTKDWNPRVVLWASLFGIPLEKLVRENEDDDLYQVNGMPWTVEYAIWMSDRWGDFYNECHGTRRQGECCRTAKFDAWLEKRVEGFGRTFEPWVAD